MLALPDLARMRARYQLPPGPCPVCGAARQHDGEFPDDGSEQWFCPATVDVPEDEAARMAWAGHYTEGLIFVRPDPDVTALVDAYEALCDTPPLPPSGDVLADVYGCISRLVGAHEHYGAGKTDAVYVRQRSAEFTREWRRLTAEWDRLRAAFELIEEDARRIQRLGGTLPADQDGSLSCILWHCGDALRPDGGRQ